MKLTTGKTLWNNITEVQKQYSYLTENIECDVAIIGGGATGALCSYYFSKEGIKTVLLEGNIVGYGSTRSSTSLLEYEIDSNLYKLKDMIGLYNAVKAFKVTEKAVYDIEEILKDIGEDCEFSLCKALYYTDKAKSLKNLEEEYDMRKVTGFDVEWINEVEAKELYSFPIKGGILSNKGAAIFNPYKFTQSIIEHSVRNYGLQVYENTKIKQIKNIKSKISKRDCELNRRFKENKKQESIYIRIREKENQKQNLDDYGSRPIIEDVLVSNHINDMDEYKKIYNDKIENSQKKIKHKPSNSLQYGLSEKFGDNFLNEKKFNIDIASEEEVNKKNQYSKQEKTLEKNFENRAGYKGKQCTVKEYEEIFKDLKCKEQLVKEKVELYTENGFKITCNKVIIATGYEANKLIDENQISLTRTFNVVTKPVKELKGWFEKSIIISDEDPYTYLRVTKDNRLIIGGEDISAKSQRILNLDDNEDKVCLEKYKKLEEKLKHMFPHIEDMEIEYKYNGIFAATEDGLPFIGEHKDYPNCYFCLAYGSNGGLYATFGAQILRDLYTKGYNEYVDIFKFGR